MIIDLEFLQGGDEARQVLLAPAPELAGFLAGTPHHTGMRISNIPARFGRALSPVPNTPDMAGRKYLYTRG